MRRLLVLMAMTCVPMAAAGQSEDKLPPEAKKAIAKYDAAVEVAKKAYDAAVAKARDQALKELGPIQSSETKKGNLELALAVKARIDELQTVANEAAGILKAPAQPPDLAKKVLGKWRAFNPGSYEAVYEIFEDGTVTTTVGATKTGTWEVADGKLVISWGVHKDRFWPPKKNGKVMEAVSDDENVKSKFTLTRID